MGLRGAGVAGPLATRLDELNRAQLGLREAFQSLSGEALPGAELPVS